MSNIPGLHLENILLVILSYVLILVINRKTSSESAILLLAILTLHHVVAYLYAFHLSRPPNEVDPANFLYLASECTKLGYCGYVGEHLYANYLAKMLALGHSIYFVFLLNVLFFVISLYFFIGISEFFDIKANRKTSIFLYSMWPSVVYFTTLNYREPFELYLLIAAVYFGLTGSKADSFTRILTCMILLLIMGLFHIKGLIFLSPIIFLILVSYKIPLTFISIGKKAVLLIIMFAVVYSSQIMLEDYINEVSHSKHNARIERSISGDIKSNDEKAKVEVLNSDTIIFEKNKNIYLSEKNYTDSDPDYINIFMRKVTYYRASLSWIKEPQTAFVSTISDSSIPEFITTYLLVYIEYLIAPFIFQVNSLLSLLAYAESVLRVLLIASSIIFLKRNPQISILFLLFLAISGMWALGVVSYGAAIRHHIQTNWILVLLGVPVISGYLRGMKLNGKKS